MVNSYSEAGLVTVLLLDLIKTSITIEAMKLMVKAMVTAIVKAAVTTMFIELLDEELKHYIYVRCNNPYICNFLDH